MKKIALMAALCLALAACTTREPLSFPDSGEIAGAHYGAYPDNYEYLVRTNRGLPANGRFHPVYAFRGEPRKMMLPRFGRYEFGWGGLVDVWSFSAWDTVMEKDLYEYLIRDDRLILFRLQGR